MTGWHTNNKTQRIILFFLFVLLSLSLLFVHAAGKYQYQYPAAWVVPSMKQKQNNNNNNNNDNEDRFFSLPQDPTKLRYRCRVAYDGSAFSGFQLQQQSRNPSPPQRTVQGELERVLSIRFDNRHIRVVGAGRTDAGVHARGQAIHFDLPWTQVVLDDEWNQQLMTSINRMLPSDIYVWNVQPAPPPQWETIPIVQQQQQQQQQQGQPLPQEQKDDEYYDDEYDDDEYDTTTTTTKKKFLPWNVMRQTCGKLYSYRICLADAMDPTQRYTRWQIDKGYAVDVERLQECLQQFVGTHDFVCFAGALEANARKTGREQLSTIRTIHKIDWVVEDYQKQYYRMDIYLNGALYKMVRNMVGTALDTALRVHSMEQFQAFLNPKNNNTNHGKLVRKDNLSKPAPPQGLTLECVFYNDSSNNNHEKNHDDEDYDSTF